MKVNLGFKTLCAVLIASNISKAQITIPCGDATATYATYEEAPLCLYFPSLDKKVVFTPSVDKFEALQIRGLYQLFNTSTTTQYIQAVSGGS